MSQFDTTIDLGWAGSQEVTVHYKWLPGFVSKDRTEPNEPAGAKVISVIWRGIDLYFDICREKMIDELEAEASENYAGVPCDNYKEAA